MGKALQVKVKTGVLVSALEKALTERKKRYDESEKASKKHEQDKKAYQASLVKVSKSPKAVVTEARHYGHWSSKDNDKQEVCVTVLVPKSLLPKEPEQPDIYHDHQYKSDCDEINNAIRVLKMTEQEYVNASTLASVSKYL